MTRFLFDTTVLIDAERGVILEDVIEEDDDVAVAAISIAELRVGALITAPRHRRRQRAFVDDIVASMPILDYDLAVAEAHAALLAEVRAQGRSRGAHDLIIAATARATRRIVLTGDHAAFSELTGVKVQTHRAF